MKPYLVDTHAHLNHPQFNGEVEATLRRAEEKGVKKIIVVGTDLEDSEKALRIAESHPNVYASVGIHPTHALSLPDDYHPKLIKLSHHPKVVAIGETGLDFFRLQPPPAEILLRQTELFRVHLGLAIQVDLPLIIHSREAFPETLRELKRYRETKRLRGVFHCLCGGKDLLPEITNLGFLVSFTGIVLYDTAQEARSTAAAVSDENYMLETDAPFLHPHRKGRNEPQNVRFIAQEIANLKGVSFNHICEITSRNAERLFKLK